MNYGKIIITTNNTKPIGENKKHMKHDKIKFTNIQPSSYNPRKMSRDEMNVLSKNLEEFGLVDPLIINLKNNRIIGGHQRYTALQKKYNKEQVTDSKELNIIRLGDIGWVFEDENLTIEDEDHEKALNLSLNKISGTWDYNKLSTLLKNLENNKFNIDLTGFNSYELEKYTIPSDLGLQFKEIEDIKDGKLNVDSEGNITQADNDEVEEKQEEKHDHEETEDDILVSEEEINKSHRYKCPECGYEW